MKYMDELKRAIKVAGYLALGVFFGTGVFPWIMAEDKTMANARLLGSLWGVFGAFAAAVGLLFVNEIMRTKRLQKKKNK